ncbi:uncharacterized protein LOC135672274 [Musa acuminata AAA Group]|uniref:uncharacterized protein LOC135635698 n=1 Tax=Musa acuminata AAA Group TaxID=214697 RepID=UPI0031DC013C
MDRDTKKRGREESDARGEAGVTTAWDLSSKKKKKKEKNNDAVDDTNVFRPPGLFEFPWQKGERLLVPEPEGWDLRSVFFSSLVDGCSAAIGVPGDRLSPTAPRPFGLLEDPTDGELDGGVDCIWSSVLRQPLSTVYSKGYNA